VRSRLAESLRVRVGRAFSATTFEELEARVERMPWAAFLGRGGAAPRVRVTCHKSRLHHSGAVGQRVLGRIRARLGLAQGAGEQQATVYVRVVRDRVQLSVDAAGELLHRRGYRSRIGEAPLRETLAAACLAAADYRGDRPLWDPFCGSGTVIIEAAAAAAGVAPGASRAFAFQSWPTHDGDAFAAFVEGLPAPADPGAQAMGSDVDGEVLAAARANARDAGVDHITSFQRGDFDAVAAQVPRGAMVVSNPPYGRRLIGALEDTYRRLGRLLRRRTDLGPVVLLSGHRDLPRYTGLRWDTLRSLDNRGLPVRLLRLER